MSPKDHAAPTIGPSGDPHDERNRLSYVRLHDERNRLSYVRLAVMIATTLVLASMAPAGLTIAAISSLAFISTVVIATFALLYREQSRAPHFTRWDEAAAMLALSLGAGLFVDPVAVEAAVAQAAQR